MSSAQTKSKTYVVSLLRYAYKTTTSPIDTTGPNTVTDLLYCYEHLP